MRGGTIWHPHFKQNNAAKSTSLDPENCTTPLPTSPSVRAIILRSLGLA
jgi:hypothetical protein